MSVAELAGAVSCGTDISCPWNTSLGMGAASNCSIPYGGSEENYCSSLKIGNISQIVVVLAFVLYMLGVGAAMEIEKAKHAVKHPKAPLVGLFCQVVLNPALMFGLIALLGKDFPVATRIMAILIASSPGGSGSNLLTMLAMGSVELSVAMTIFSTFCAFATMPLFVYLGTEVFWANESASLKVDYLAIFLAASAATLLPLCGLAVKERWSEKVGSYFSTYGTLIGVVGTICAALLYLADPLFRKGLANLGVEIWLCAIGLNLGGLLIGYSASVLSGFPRRFHRTIAFEVGSQNINIPLAIVTITFKTGPVLTLFTPFLGAYLIGSIPVNYGIMLVLRFLFPITEPHHDGFDEKDEDQLCVKVMNESNDCNTMVDDTPTL